MTLDYSFDQKKLIVSPEYSNQTGLSLGAAFAAMLSERAAVGLVLSAGSDKKEALVNAGFRLDERQRLILTAGQLRQSLNYAFPSGSEKVETSQNSAGASYQYQLGQGVLRTLEANAYLAQTASRDLGAKNFVLDTATLYELWSDPRRIAGGRVSGFQGRLGLSPFVGSLMKFSFGQEHLSYDLLTGRDGVSRATGGVEWLQQLSDGFQFKAGAETFASQNRYTLGLERSLAGADGRHNVGLAFASLRGRDGVGNDDQVKLTYSYAFAVGAGAGVGRVVTRHPVADVGGSRPALQPAPQAVNGNALLDQVAQRPSFLPSHVVAKVDHTAAPLRLIAVDKNALPAGTTVNTTTGDVTVPLAVAVAGIAGITKNGVAFANAGEFSLVGNSLVVKPSLIVQPAAGVVDSYVVTLNNVGGGTTLATVSVSKGSVKIDSITVVAATLPAGYITQGGLTWTPNTIMPPTAAYPQGYSTWTNANAFCASHSVNGLTGWRLPTKDELVSLYNSVAMNGVSGWALGSTWSATAIEPGVHYAVGLGNSFVYWTEDWDNGYVSCVR